MYKSKSMFWNFKRSYWDRLLKSLSHASFPEYSPYGSKFIRDQVQGYSDIVACLSNNKLLCTSALCRQMQMKLMEMKELENHNNQLNWCGSPHSILVNGATDYCSLSTSSSEAANLNEHAEGQSNLESEPIHQESPVSLTVP